MDSLPDLFKAAGLEAIEACTIDVTFSPVGKLVAKMTDALAFAIRCALFCQRQAIAQFPIPRARMP